MPVQPAVPERVAVAAAGDAAAFVVGPGPAGPGPAAGLWYGPLGGEPARLSDLVPDTNLAFAPDGARFALAVQDDAGSRLIIADPAAAPDRWAQHRLPVFAERVAWTADGLVVLAADPGADAASLTSGKPLGSAAADPVIAPAAAGWRRLWRVDPDTGTAAAASPDGLAVWEFAPIPGGGAVVVASADPTEAGWYHARLIALDAGGALARVLRTSPWQLAAPAVSFDGRSVAFIEGWASDRGLLAGEVFVLSIAGDTCLSVSGDTGLSINGDTCRNGAAPGELGSDGAAADRAVPDGPAAGAARPDRGVLDRAAPDGGGPEDARPPAGPLDVGVDVTWLSWGAGGSRGARLWLAGWQHLGTAWGWADNPAGGLVGNPPGGRADNPVGGPAGNPAHGPAAWVQAEAASCLNSPWHPEVVPLPDGSALTVRSTPELPPEVVRLRPGGAPAAWTALNAGLAGSRPLRVRDLSWLAPDGTPIEGLLAVPAGPDGAGGPWPLVVDIHGGPSLAWHHSWDLRWAEILTAAGYAVLMPNPRGSAGRGQRFAKENLSDPAGAEFDDILAGVAHCVAGGLADPARVAAMGASYGGYLTAWAIAGGGVFRCGVVIAGISDLVSCRGTANNAPFYDYLLAGRPAELPARYLERSPVTRLSAASRPALILHGEQDRCVPLGQAAELHAGLREFGVPVEFVSYPREGHQAREPAHVADQRDRVLRWFASHLEVP